MEEAIFLVKGRCRVAGSCRANSCYALREIDCFFCWGNAPLSFRRKGKRCVVLREVPVMFTKKPEREMSGDPLTKNV